MSPSTRRIAAAVRAVTALLVDVMRASVERGDWPSAHWPAA
ncbi:hypothetical protein [Burkholderia pyrrocinia]|uniref:Uncharacterized protein n=1 Tax=Burkholderia pyrrocinia TaxID=60550 RepID=A0ABZ3BW13_BURPY